MTLCSDNGFMKASKNNRGVALKVVKDVEKQPFLIKYPNPKRKLSPNTIYCADNLEVMKQLPTESINMIYIDPPFNTGTVRKSKTWDREIQLGDFDDKWGGGIASYRLWLKQRLRQMHRLLKKDGVLCVHLDYNAVHYAKVDLDEIFGQGSYDKGSKHLINEIIWFYKTGGASKKQFAKKHDVILIYGKSKSWTFNPKKEKTYTKSKGRKAGIQNYGAGDCEFFEDENGVYNLTYEKDVWDIPYLNSQARERLGYPTQKPRALLDKIIKAFTNKNDIVADFFCGCGTTISSAESLGRYWLGVDASKKASKVIRKRMARDHDLKIKVIPLKSLTREQIEGLDPFEFERYCVRGVGGIPNEKQRGDGGIDGFLIQDGTPIQVKKSKNVGRPVVDSFHKHLKINGRGIIIAKSFGRGAKEEVARLKLSEGYEVSLITVDDILREAS